MESKLALWLVADRYRMSALRSARELNLSDWCLAAGFVRNLVWDKTHHYHTATPLNDIDLIYFDIDDNDKKKDRDLESTLKQKSDLPWSVKNQARMHLRNNDANYRSTEDAMSYWPEIETAIGARLNWNDEIEIIAPFGLEALFCKTVTLNSKRQNSKFFMQRVNTKGWLTRWPELTLIK